MSNPSLIQAEAAARAATRDKFIADTAAEERPSPSTKRAARKALKALHGAEVEMERIRALPPTPADCAHYVARGMLHAAKSFALISRQAHEISEKIAEDPDKEFLAYGAALARVAKIHLENFALSFYRNETDKGRDCSRDRTTASRDMIKMLIFLMKLIYAWAFTLAAMIYLIRDFIPVKFCGRPPVGDDEITCRPARTAGKTGAEPTKESLRQWQISGEGKKMAYNVGAKLPHAEQPAPERAEASRAGST